MKVKLTSDLIASMVVAAAAETGARPEDVLRIGAKGVSGLGQRVTQTRRAVLLALPDRQQALELGAKLQWWNGVPSARAVINEAARKGEDDSLACEAAREALQEFLEADGGDDGGGDDGGDDGGGARAKPAPDPVVVDAVGKSPAPAGVEDVQRTGCAVTPPDVSSQSSAPSGAVAPVRSVKPRADLRIRRKVYGGTYAAHPDDREVRHRAADALRKLAAAKPHLKPVTLSVIVGHDLGLIASSDFVRRALSERRSEVAA
jgi:hypothetical protein